MSHTVTMLLDRWQAGEAEAINELIPAAMSDLRQLAGAALRGRDAANVQATELINETYLKLVGIKTMSWRSRVQFFALAGKVMRNILLDRIRRKQTEKGCDFQVELATRECLNPEELVIIHEALEQLAGLDERKAAVLELRLFAGLGHEDIARYFGVSQKTIKRDWQFARTWLYGRMKKEQE